MANPDYATLLPLIAAETDPVARQALIEQAYQFNEPLTDEEAKVWAYLENLEDYVSDSESNYAGYTEYVGAYFNPEGTSSGDAVNNFQYTESIEIVSVSPTEVLESDLIVSVGKSFTVRIETPRPLKYDITFKLKFTFNTPQGQTGEYTMPLDIPMLGGWTYRNQSVYLLKSYLDPMISARLESPFITVEIVDAVVTNDPTLTVGTGEIFTKTIIDDRLVAATLTATYDVQSRTDTSSHGTITVSVDTAPPETLFVDVKVKTGAASKTFSTYIPAGQTSNSIQASIPQGNIFFDYWAGVSEVIPTSSNALNLYGAINYIPTTL